MGMMYETYGIDPSGTGARVWGRGDTKEESLRQCKLALNEYLAKTGRWSYWSEWVDNGFTFDTEERSDIYYQEDPT